MHPFTPGRILLLALVCTACAGRARPDAGTPAPSPDRIDRAEIVDAADVETIYRLVERRRPDWLEAARAETSGRTPRADQVAVYLDGDRLGGLILLHTIPTTRVRQVRRLSPREASAEGLRLEGATEGAIVVVTDAPWEAGDLLDGVGRVVREVALTVYPVGYASVDAGRGLDAALDEHPSFTDVSSEAPSLLPLLGLRIGLAAPAPSIELLAGLAGGNRVTAVDGRCDLCRRDRENRWDQTAGVFTGAVVHYELGGLRVGAGPTLSFSRWSWERERCTATVGCYGDSPDTLLRVVSVGAVADVSYRLDIPIPHLFADVKLQGRYARASPTFTGLDVGTIQEKRLFLIVGLGLR